MATKGGWLYGSEPEGYQRKDAVPTIVVLPLPLSLLMSQDSLKRHFVYFYSPFVVRFEIGREKIQNCKQIRKRTTEESGRISFVTRVRREKGLKSKEKKEEK